LDDPVTCRVSVVVAVYNPGPSFDDLVASLDLQTLPGSDFEVLLCDDGSDAETQRRLDAVAADRPMVTVLRLAHTGWPGTPRNAGLDAARGTYVFFADHDDYLSDEALERLVDYADANASDVVLGRLVGVRRLLPLDMFQRNIPRARLGVDPLLGLLTPHKLFRTDFLRRHGIRFPDGRVRLEDHLLVMRSYFAAEVISVLADHPCYYWTYRLDRPSASASPIDPRPYFASMERVLEVVAANTEPGRERDVLLTHWYQGKVLKRLGSQAWLRRSEEYRAEFWAVVRELSQRWFPPALEQHLPFPLRLRSALLRADRPDAVLELGRIEAQLVCTLPDTSADWVEGVLHVAARAEVSYADGTPLVFEGDPADPGGAAGVWAMPEPVAPDVLTTGVRDAGRDLAEDSLQFFLRDLGDEAIYHQGPAVPGLRGSTTINPRSARFGRPAPPALELLAEVHRAGWSFVVPVPVEPDLLARLGREIDPQD
jgi:glycosyltransferase involved in cell wall biosynthesis